jgi:hypothetical protein
LHFFACDSSRKFQGHHPHLSCFFQGTELRDWLGFGDHSPRLDAVGLSIILTPPAPLVANAKPLERSKSFWIGSEKHSHGAPGKGLNGTPGYEALATHLRMSQTGSLG